MPSIAPRIEPRTGLVATPGPPAHRRALVACAEILAELRLAWGGSMPPLAALRRLEARLVGVEPAATLPRRGRAAP